MLLRRVLQYSLLLLCMSELGCSDKSVYYGVKILIRNEDQKPLYVVTSAWYDDGRRMWGEAAGSSDGRVVRTPVPPNGERIALFCGTNPDFHHLLVQVAIWELPTPDSSLDGLLGKEPAFVILLRRPEFDYSKEEYIYTDFAVIERQKGGPFRLSEPATDHLSGPTSESIGLQKNDGNCRPPTGRK